MSDKTTKNNGQYIEYFGKFPLLEGLILFRYKTIVNFCRKMGFSTDSVCNYFRGQAKPPYEFICKCLAEFDTYTFEDLFKENSYEEVE